MGRAGFSLIELVLAISLSIALVALIGFAIDLHLVRLDSSRSTIEQAQIARAILDRIASDLRGATTAPTQDVSELMTAAEAAAQFNVDEVDQSTESVDDESTGGVASELDATPGLNGVLNSLTIDTRQVWRKLSMPAEGGSPIARVDAGWTQVAYGMSQIAESPGLIRTETPRDTALWRVEQGQPAPVADPIAAEVRRIEFRYWDGEQLLEVWDMSEQTALPMAVEIQLELAPADEAGAENSNTERQTPKLYRRVVRLPAASDESGGASASSSADSSAMGGV